MTTWGLSDEAKREVAAMIEQGRNYELPSVRTQRRQHFPGPAPTGVKFRNDSGEEIPPYAVMEVADSAYKPDSSGYYGVIRPTAKRTSWGWLINNSPLPVAIDGTSPNGAWSYDGNILCLVDPDSITPYDYGDSYRFSSGYAPRPGYWHLRRGGDADIAGIGGGDGNAEDYGFLQTCPDHILLSDYEYDYGDGDVNPIAKKFMQLPEQAELSVEFPVRTTFYKDVAGTPTAHTTAIGDFSPYCLRPYQTENSVHSRVGVEVINGDGTSLTCIKFLRTGLYKVEVKLYLKTAGNLLADATSFSDETVSGGGGGTYKKPTGLLFNPIQLRINALSKTPGTSAIGLDDGVLVYPYNAVVYRGSLSCVGENYHTVYTQFHVQSWMTTTDFTDTSHYEELGISLKALCNTTATTPGTLAIQEGPQVAAGVDGQERSWIKITRLRTATRVME